MFVFFSPEFCDEKAKYQGKMIDEVDLIAIGTSSLQRMLAHQDYYSNIIL